MNASRDFNGISTLKKYYGQLHNLASRFPMEEGGEAAIYFSWLVSFHDDYQKNKATINALLQMSCLLFLIAIFGHITLKV